VLVNVVVWGTAHSCSRGKVRLYKSRFSVARCGCPRYNEQVLCRMLISIVTIHLRQARSFESKSMETAHGRKRRFVLMSSSCKHFEFCYQMTVNQCHYDQDPMLPMIMGAEVRQLKFRLIVGQVRPHNIWRALYLILLAKNAVPGEAWGYEPHMTVHELIVQCRFLHSRCHMHAP
jgi:hypothetical protein